VTLPEYRSRRNPLAVHCRHLADLGAETAQTPYPPEAANCGHGTRLTADVTAVTRTYATHKHPKVRQWLARHRRWTFHFTPTSASWLNAVETFFAKLTRRRLKRGVFRSVDELKAAINRFVAETNANPRPFVWTADPNRVLAAVKRGKQALESIH